MNRRVFLLCLAVCATMIATTPVQADAIRVAGGLTTAAANLLYCQLTGCTMTGTTTYSGVTTDITSTSNQDLTVVGAGTGSVVIQSGDNATDFVDSAGNVDATAETSAASARFRMSNNNNAIGWGATGGYIGVTNNAAATAIIGQIGESCTVASGCTNFVQVYGQGQVVNLPGTALVTGSPTDTTTQPNGAGSACRMSSTGASAYTPSETNAVDGAFFCCTNTGANVITMTESAGVYEGPATASAVGQFDTVCFEYVTDRWVERSFSNN